MRAIMLDRVQPSMRLGKTLFAGDGRVLLHRGTELSDAYLEHLRSLGFTALYVEDPRTEGVEAPELVSDKTRLVAVAAVKTAFAGLKDMQGHKFQHGWSGRRSLYNAASSIVTEVSASKDLCIQLMELRSSDGYTFAHSVNVCILGMALARKLEVPYNKMVDLAIGLLIHDIGKLLLPEELRDATRELTSEEAKAYEHHAEAGYGLLKDLGSTFGAPSKIVALQHHERWDGQGYPRGLKGDQIHEFAQICAIANTYDRLTTSAAFGRRAAPHEALEFIMGAGGTLFRLPLVQAFLEIVAPYPLGSTVKLNTGEIGVVVRIEKGLPQRPVLRMLADHSGDEFRLTDHQDRVVVGVVEV
jgi:HD-GYP domain-containing protein (c-di-GMP phosphodiesterase class II)